MLTCNLDPFKNYKRRASMRETGDRVAGGPEWPPTLSLYLTEDERLGETQLDRKRHKVAKFMRPLVCYLAAKMIAIGVVQFLLLSHQLHHSDQTKWRPPIDWALLHKLEQLLGNPLAVLSAPSVIFYIGMAGLLVLKLVILPELLKGEPKRLNMTAVRFMLRPAIEFRRLETAAKQRLGEIENSIRHYTHNLATIQLKRARRQEEEALLSQSSSSTDSPMPIATMSLGTMPPDLQISSGSSNKFKMRDSCMRMLALARSLQEGRESRELYWQVIRPEWHQTLYAYMTAGIPTILGAFSCWGLSLFIIIGWIVVRRHKCAKAMLSSGAANATSTVFYRHGINEGDRCRLFGTTDALFVLEFVPISGICIMTETLAMFCLSVCIVHQLKLINSMREQLVELSSLLLGGSKTATTSHLDSDSSGTTNHRLILSMIVKLHVFDSELKSGFEDITWQVATFAYHATGLAGLTMFTAQLQASNSKLVLGFLLVVCLIWFNLIGLMCSYIHVQYDHLARLYWVVSARLAWIECELDWLGLPTSGRVVAIEDRKDGVAGPRSATKATKAANTSDRQLVFDSSRLDSYRILVSLFHKFLMATGPDTKSYCISPFGVQLTYRQLIEFNFISMLVITLTRNVVGNRAEAGLR
jgi:hypothetical protein